MNNIYVIIGSGVAAVTAAKTIRDLDMDGTIHILGKESTLPYNRIKLSKELFSDLGSEKVLIKKVNWYEENNIIVHVNKKVVSINSDAQMVITEDGDEISYNKLLICTGSNNRKMSLEGINLKGVFTIREMHDANECKNYIEDKNHTLIVGGGIQGLETAWSLYRAGKKVSIVEVAPRLMARQLDERASDIVKNKLEEMGIEVYLGVSIGQILGQEEVTGVLINEKETIDCDNVIYSIGIQPNIELLLNTPIKTNRGVIVNREMKTNVEGIYAAGDVAELDGEIEGIWNKAMEQGEIAGSNMVGSMITYKNIIPTTIFRAFDIELFSVGTIDEKQCDQTIMEHDFNGRYTRIFLKDKRIVGVISFEGAAASMPYNKAIEKEILFDDLDINNISISELLEEIKKRKDM